MNLLEETLDDLKDVDKTCDDVRWVGTRNGAYSIPWDEFVKIANVTYDSGYGGNEIASDLVIVGDDWWMSRGEYDGSEWWDFNTIPLKKDGYNYFKEVLCDTIQ